jgi:hypothetical protein
MHNTTAITIARTTGGTRDRMRAYKILIDGAATGTIKAGESITVPVDPGLHSVQLKLDWCTSPTVTVETTTAGSTKLSCSPGGSAMAALWDMLRPGAYITLDHVTQ